MPVEKLVLRYPESVPAAVIYACLLVLAGKHLLSWIRAQDASYEYAGAQTGLLGTLSRENAELLVEFCGFTASYGTVQ